MQGAWREEGGKLVGKFRNDKGGEFTFIREIVGGELVQVTS